MAGPQIVSVVVSQQVAPAPSTLQRTGAFVSQGGTSLADATYALLTQSSDLAPLLRGAVTITSLTWAAGVVTATLSAPHTIDVGESLPITIAGATPAGYNGTFTGTATSATVVTYPLATNPGTNTAPGTFTLEDVAELMAMVTTFFAQGNATPVYVLEFGADPPADGVTALAAYIANPALQFYTYCVPASWGGEPTFITYAKTLTALTAKTYFFVTMTLAQFPNWVTAAAKSVFGIVQTPATLPPATTEFDAAAAMHVILTYNPSNTAKVTPTNYSYLFAVTAYSTLTGPQKTALKAAFVNYVDTGAEGGISNTIIKGGFTMDGRDFTYWYSVDWVQIQSALALANAVINGSNNPQNPLYYDQAGINRLQAVEQGVMNNGVSFGLVNGVAPVTAIPYSTYVAANPSDYPAGIYKGLSVTFTPNRGFTSITFNVTVSDLPQS